MLHLRPCPVESGQRQRRFADEYHDPVLSSGVTLNNRYLLYEKIAAGGMGEVWWGTDVLLQRKIAVKVLLPALVSDQEFITRFRTEARMMAALRHPGIVQVYDYGQDAEVNGDRLDYLVMEYIEGAPLSKRIQAAGKLGAGETTAIIAQAAEALQVAHNAGIVHRDVKPSNLLVRSDGTVVLVDFGVARSAGVDSITGTNVVLGSAQYMAPEQALGQPISAATDVYALGAVAYCCLAGRPPYIGDNPVQVIGQLLHGEPPTLPAEVPQQTAQLVRRALDKEPTHRFPSAAAFASAARAAQGGAPTAAVHAHPLPPAQPVAPAQPPRQAPPAGQAPPARQAQPVGPAQPARQGPPAGQAQPARQAPPTGHPAGYPQPAGRPQAAGQPVAYPQPVAQVQRAAAPPPMDAPADGGNRRRNATLAAVAAAVVIGLISLVTVVALRPETSQAQEGPPTNQPPGGAGAFGGGGPEAGIAEQASDGPIGQTPDPARTKKTPPSKGAPASGATPTGSGSGSGTSTTTGSTPQPTTTTTQAPATNPYSPAQVCGSGYTVIDSSTLKKSDGTVVGKVYLLYNSGNGYNCTTLLKSTSIGTKTTTSAYLEKQGGSRTTASGSYAYYAGPVRVKAPGVCVKWGGTTAGVSYNSPFEHCD